MARRWHFIRDEELLDLRLCDLPLDITGTVLEARIQRLYSELTDCGLSFRPHVWLGESWFSPDGIPGIAIPFYLAHPRLVQLERKQMLTTDGNSEKTFMRLLRHETGHALNTAYRLHYRHRYRDLFGSYTQPYPDDYKPRPNSRNFVLHLGAWYAQSHPAEDFAETFAVWLTPRSRWRTRYRNWPAIEKLEYVDELMQEIARQPAKNIQRNIIEPMSELTITLREYYHRKRARYSFTLPPFYDRDLLRIFPNDPRHAERPTAASFLLSIRQEIREIVSEGTGIHQYTINHVIENMIRLCRKSRLRMSSSKREARRQVLVLVTVQAMNILHAGYHRIPV